MIFGRCMQHTRLFRSLWAILAIAVFMVGYTTADNYEVAEGNQSLMVAIGCFWCGEQAFEQYAPGVIETVSGYAGGTNDNPTYRNHPGHYEVVLIEYDPKKTSYEVLVNYAYHNMDPFDGNGQFCDKGSSYYPAIFYETDAEMQVAEAVLAELLEKKGWQREDIAAPILPRPKFWIAEEYHQDYYIKNPSNYGYYKNACGRPQRLKEIWGMEDYTCYHDKSHGCFLFDLDTIDPENSNITGFNITVGNPGVVNADGVIVSAESNIKGAGDEVKGLLPRWAIILICVLVPMVGFAIILYLVIDCRKRNKMKSWRASVVKEGEKKEEAKKEDVNIEKPKEEPKKQEQEKDEEMGGEKEKKEEKMKEQENVEKEEEGTPEISPAPSEDMSV